MPLFCGAGTFGQDRNRSASQQSATAVSPAAQQAFATNCASCHGLDGKGGERAPDVVTRPNIRQLSNDELFEIVQKGIPRKSMPAFGYLGDPLIRSIVAYLRVLQGNPVPRILPGDSKRGKELFFGKGQCSTCHSFRGEGGFFASDLTDYSRGRSPEVARDAIVSPNKNLDSRNRTAVVRFRNGKTFEGIARNEDNFSIQLLTRDGVIHLLTKSELASITYRDESPMPSDYGAQLSPAELDDLVNYLYSVARHETKPAAKNEEPDEEE